MRGQAPLHHMHLIPSCRASQVAACTSLALSLLSSISVSATHPRTTNVPCLVLYLLPLPCHPLPVFLPSARQSHLTIPLPLYPPSLADSLSGMTTASESSGSERHPSPRPPSPSTSATITAAPSPSSSPTESRIFTLPPPPARTHSHKAHRKRAWKDDGAEPASGYDSDTHHNSHPCPAPRQRVTRRTSERAMTMPSSRTLKKTSFVLYLQTQLVARHFEGLPLAAPQPSPVRAMAPLTHPSIKGACVQASSSDHFLTFFTCYR